MRHLELDRQLETLGDDYSVFVLGHEFERWFLENSLVEEYEAEKFLTFDIDEQTAFEGHADVVSDSMVYELKSVSSPNVYRQIFKRSKPKIANIVQLVGYMLASDRYVGKLVYGAYVDVVEYTTLTQLSKDEVLELVKDFKPEIKSFHVTVDSETGDIKVDGLLQDFTTADLIAFWKETATFLNAPEDTPLPARPTDITKKNGNVCFFCNKKAICAVSETMTKKSFLTATQDFINKRNTDGE
jgi:hypothetical protein